MELQYTLEAYAAQLKNKPRTLINVAGVVQKIMKTVYDAHFPNAEDRRPGRNPDTPDSDILTIAWHLEYSSIHKWIPYLPTPLVLIHLIAFFIRVVNLANKDRL